MKRKILLQCQSITYFYMGLAAIYTKYPDRDVEVHVLFTPNNENKNEFLNLLEKSKYPDYIHCHNFKNLRSISKKILKLKNNLLGRTLFPVYKKIAINILKKYLDPMMFSDVFYSHELGCFLMTYFKLANPNINLALYGDGSGLLTQDLNSLINPFSKSVNSPFMNATLPDEIRSLSPYVEDGTNAFDNIPVIATNKETFVDLAENDELIQKEINDFSEYLKTTYKDRKISLLLASKLYDSRFMMSEAEQDQIYVDIVRQHCQKGGVVILKKHPTSKQDLKFLLSNRLQNEYEVIELPENITPLPVEIFAPIIKQLDIIITFLSSSKVSLARLYNIKTESAFDIIQNYNLKTRVKPFLDVYENVVKNFETWDEKSIIYKTDIIPEIKKFYDK